MPGPRNMHAVREVGSYYAYSNEKVVRSDPNNNGLKRIVRS